MEFLRFLEALRTPLLDCVMSVVTAFGGETVFMLAAMAAYWCYDKRFGYYIMSTGFIGTVLNQFFKLIFHVPRPWVLDGRFTIVESAREGATGYSFPSGHTQNAVTVFGTTARWTRRPAIRIAALILIVLVAFSRMYLGVHTPADVLFSLALGAALTLVLYPLFRTEKTARTNILLFGGMLFAAVLYVLFLEFYSFPSWLDAENFAAAKKNAYTLAGAVLGLCAGYPVEKRFVRFSTHAPWWGQLLKLTLGAACMVLLQSLLKDPLYALFSGHNAADAMRYFIMVFFAMAVWPAAFPLFRVRSAKEKR